jgi:transcriptional regulator with XRE-family HTH domain
MDRENEIWLVSGGQPGAVRFGQFVQRIRKEKRLSVQGLADEAELSAGTIRAIEQGRRAPSEESGLRILRLLMPEGDLSENRFEIDGNGPTHSFTDPSAGTRVLLKFGAKTAGDNRRWSKDKPAVGESRVEAAVRELLSDPKRYAKWAESILPAFENLASVAQEAMRTAERPASDADFGRVVRRLMNANEFRVDRLMSLMDLWDRVDNGDADVSLRERVSEINSVLDNAQIVFDSESETSWIDG